MDILRYWLAVILVVSLPPAMVYWGVGHHWVSRLRALGLVRTYAILGTAFVLALLPLLRFRDILIGSDRGYVPGLAWLGAALWLVSMYLEVKCRKHLKIKTLVGVPEFRGDVLDQPMITAGIYQRMRHPRYVSVTVGVVAAALVANFVGSYLAAVLLIPALYWITILEEHELVERYGPAYREYQSAVSRFVPTWSSRRS